MNKLRNFKLIAISILSIVLVSCTSYGRGGGQVEVVEASEKSPALGLLQQVNELETENSELKNQVEVLQFELDQLNRRAQSQQQELDRLYQEQGLTGYSYEGNTSVVEATVVPGENPPLNVPAATEEIQIGTQQSQYPAVVPSSQNQQSSAFATISAQDMYNSGFEQLKQGQYDESIKTFNQLLATHPTSTFADDAQYWSGEAYYVNRDYNNARAAFNNVVRNYPNSDRAADALLKIGYIYYDQGDVENARNTFNNIIGRYPNSQVSEFARERLRNLGG